MRASPGRLASHADQVLDDGRLPAGDDKRAETLEEMRLYELRHAEAVGQIDLAGRLDVTQGVVSKLEQADDVRVSTLRQYLEALGARRVPINPARNPPPDPLRVAQEKGTQSADGFLPDF